MENIQDESGAWKAKRRFWTLLFFIFYLHPQIMEEMKQLFLVLIIIKGEKWKYSLGLDQGNGFDLEKWKMETQSREITRKKVRELRETNNGEEFDATHRARNEEKEYIFIYINIYINQRKASKLLRDLYI